MKTHKFVCESARKTWNNFVSGYAQMWKYDFGVDVVVVVVFFVYFLAVPHSHTAYAPQKQMEAVWSFSLCIVYTCAIHTLLYVTHDYSTT